MRAVTILYAGNSKRHQLCCVHSTCRSLRSSRMSKLKISGADMILATSNDDLQKAFLGRGLQTHRTDDVMSDEAPISAVAIQGYPCRHGLILTEAGARPRPGRRKLQIGSFRALQRCQRFRDVSLRNKKPAAVSCSYRTVDKHATKCLFRRKRSRSSLPAELQHPKCRDRPSSPPCEVFRTDSRGPHELWFGASFPLKRLSCITVS